MDKAERLRRVKLDVDTRLVELYAHVWRTELHGQMDDDDRELLAATMRAAYALGYRDCLNEVEQDSPNALARDNGYTKEA